MRVFFIVQWSYYLSLLLSCTLTGFLSVRKSWSLEYKLLVILSSLTFLSESACFLFIGLRIPFLWIQNLFTPVECTFILYILRKASVRPVFKRLHAVLLILLPIGIGVIYGLLPAFFKLDDFAALFYLFLELIAACTFLVDILLNKSDTPLGRQPLAWMASGMVFYCSIYAVMTAVTSFIAEIPLLYKLLYSTVANTFIYAGFIACFICLRRARGGGMPAVVDL